MEAKVEDIVIAGTRIAPGETRTLDLPVANLYTHGALNMPLRVVRGQQAGPSLFVNAALHGDEINGVEIIRRLLRLRALKRLRGTLLAAPVVNVFGFVGHSRYLPDRRDLNRSFPGSEKGSLAARLAHLFMREVVSNATHGVDLHSGSVHRSNLPQVRANLQQAGVKRMAEAFGAPVILDSPAREGSLRAAVLERGIPLIVYEGGEAFRFDEESIRSGLRGLVNVMFSLGMLELGKTKRPASPTLWAKSSSWVRAPESGVLRDPIALGARVREGEVVGRIGDPFGENVVEVQAHISGIVIGRLNLPLVSEGDAIFHIAQLARESDAQGAIEDPQTEVYTSPALPVPDQEEYEGWA